MGTTEGITDGTQLLRSVAEQLKVPLSLIARQAELGQLTGNVCLENLESIGVHATAALTLVDCYLLGLQLAKQQMKLDFEPVSVSSLLVEVAHELEPLAAQYQTDVQVHIGGKYEPVMAHRAGFKAALLSLGYAFLSGQQAARRNLLTLAVHRNARGIVTGMYSAEKLNADSWRRAIELAGSATKPLSSLTGSSAGLFVSNSIFNAMSAELKAGKYQRQQGLAAILQPSHQLELIPKPRSWPENPRLQPATRSTLVDVTTVTPPPVSRLANYNLQFSPQKWVLG